MGWTRNDSIGMRCQWNIMCFSWKTIFRLNIYVLLGAWVIEVKVSPTNFHARDVVLSHFVSN